MSREQASCRRIRALVLGAGFIGSVLNCEDGCSEEPGGPSWLRPWIWGDYDVWPEALYIGLAGLAAAFVFVVLVFVRRALLAAVALITSLMLLSYPFFAGLTSEGIASLWFGPLLGVAAIVAMWRRPRRDRRPDSALQD